MTSSPATARRLEFSKGHGTENDFVIIADPEGTLDLSDADVRFLCDRHAGIGADGVLRVTRCRSVLDGAPYVDSAEWFMDYRNADGSVAEMCGNGVRVFAQYLLAEGHVPSTPLAVGSRGGIKVTTYEPDGSISVDMGPAQHLGASTAALGSVQLTGQAVSMGNPHLVCDLTGSGLLLDELELHRQPSFDRAFFPMGVNIEFVQTLGEPPEGYDAHVRMRVHERGVGETRSCGTGVCAVASTALATLGKTHGYVLVDVPGGRLHTLVSTERVILRGPAVIVASGTALLPPT